MVHGREPVERRGTKVHRSYKKNTAELLQQFSGTPRFEKRRLHLRTV